MSDVTPHAPVFGERRLSIALAALAFIVLNIGLASSLVIAAYKFDLTLFVSGGGLIDRGPDAAGLLRLGSLVDMLGYLALVPVALYLHGRIRAALPARLRDLGLAGMVTFSALGFAIVGAIGAVTLASAGAWLLGAAATGSGTPAVARLQFGALEKLVFVGLWGCLEQVLLGTWVIGVSWVVRAEARAFAWLGGFVGAGALAYAARTGLTGETPLPIGGPADVFIIAAIGALPLWVAWLGLRLWRGPRPIKD